MNKDVKRQNWIGFILLCALGLLMNFGGARLCSATGLPLYLDTSGTIFAAVLGGYLPGITVGFLSNVVNGIVDYSSLYYSSLNVLIAVTAAYFSRKGYLKKISGILLSIVTFSLIGGALGSVMTWLLYGFDFGTGVSAPLVHRIFDKGILNAFWSQFAGDMIIDLLDKTVSVLFAAIIIRLLPDELEEKLCFYGWKQTPLTRSEADRTRKCDTRRWSLRSKLLFLIGIATTLVAVVITWIAVLLYHNSIVDQSTKLAYAATNIISSNIDPARVGEYLAKGEDATDYKAVKKRIAAILESTPDIEYVYVYKILPDGCHVVFDIDTEEVKGSPVGTVIPFDESFESHIQTLLSGGMIEPVVSNDSYGWLLTVYQPIVDAAGECQCYAGVDVSMSKLTEHEYMFFARIISLFIGFFILIIAFGVWFAEYHVIYPINSMSVATDSFAYNTEDVRHESLDRIRNLKICTGDEIEKLYHSVEKTTEDTMRYIEEANHKNEVINKMQNGLIMVLADLVESRDQYTGDHVRKTAVYAQIIMNQLKKEGVYTDQLTEEFMQDVVNSAPLHDLGKIQVPDAILNKPGRLTDEEFDLMKGHAPAGGEIIQEAIGAISEDGNSGYLKEARNLARYHHEKWDGTGYPDGIAGEDIPLSARIMAVADVYDALVSKRSYKDSFPFEKAMDIIRQGSGTHFDPAVAQAFLDAEEEVRKVSGN